MRRSQVPKNSTPRLACVKPAASVHPEPGSNSSSYIVDLIYIRSYCYSNQSLSVHLSISRLSYSLFFCFNISVKTAVNSICLRTCFFFVSLVSQSGCKSRKLISNWQENFEVFFENFFSISLLFFSNLSMSFPYFAGCKCNIRFQFSQAFFNLFLKINFLFD